MSYKILNSAAVSHENKTKKEPWLPLNCVVVIYKLLKSKSLFRYFLFSGKYYNPCDNKRNR